MIEPQPSVPGNEPSGQNQLSVGNQSLWQILRESVQLYRHHWHPLTRPLLMPIVQCAFGLYSALILSYLFIQYIADYHLAFAQNNLWLILLMQCSILAGTMSWFFKGGWEYLVYWTSLNINATETIENRPINIAEAYRIIAVKKKRPYLVLISVYCILPLLACLPILVAPVLNLLINPLQNVAIAGLLVLGGMLITLLLFLLWTISLIFLTLIFQITAFEDIPENPAGTFIRSTKMVLQRPWVTLGLQVILLVATTYLLTQPAAWLLRLLYITAPLDSLHLWLGTLMVDSLNESGGFEALPIGVSLIRDSLPEIAALISNSVVMMTLSALLLPWGTFAFTLLYRDIQPRQQASSPSKNDASSL